MSSAGLNSDGATERGGKTVDGIEIVALSLSGPLNMDAKDEFLMSVLPRARQGKLSASCLRTPMDSVGCSGVQSHGFDGVGIGTEKLRCGTV